MGTYDTIGIPVKGQPISSGAYGIKVRDAIVDLDTRVSQVEGLQQTVIKRGRRITSTGNITTTETGFLRLDNIPVQAGRIYQINTANINVDTSVANDIADVPLRVAFSATTGTVATTASAKIGHLRETIDDPTQSNVLPMNAFYVAPSDGYISLLLSLVRVNATGGNLIIFASSTEILDLVVQYAGSDPGDTGVIL
jgi:hypothetical protein